MNLFDSEYMGDVVLLNEDRSQLQNFPDHANNNAAISDVTFYAAEL